jgi:hypothetical protein
MNRAIICLSLAALLTTSSAAGCALDVAATCKAAGGTYTAEGTCTQYGPSQQAARDECKASGGVYLVGSNTCVLGSGGP